MHLSSYFGVCPAQWTEAVLLPLQAGINAGCPLDFPKSSQKRTLLQRKNGSNRTSAGSPPRKTHRTNHLLIQFFGKKI